MAKVGQLKICPTCPTVPAETNPYCWALQTEALLYGAPHHHPEIQKDFPGPDRSPTPLLRLWVCRANESLSLQLLSEGMKMNQLSHTYSAGNKEQSLTNTDSEGLGWLRSHTARLWHTPTLALSHIQSAVTPLLCPGYVGR